MKNKKHIAIISYGQSGADTLFERIRTLDISEKSDRQLLNPWHGQFTEEQRDIIKSHNWYNDHLKDFIDSAEAEDKTLVISITPEQYYDLDISFLTVLIILSIKFDFIFVKRENALARVYDFYEKHATKANPSHIPDSKLTLDPVYILRMMKETEELHKDVQERIDTMKDFVPESYWSTRDFKHIELEYKKDLQGDMSKTIDTISSTFGVSSCVDIAYLPAIPESLVLLKDKIENFEEIFCILKGTKYEWMLYE